MGKTFPHTHILQKNSLKPSFFKNYHLVSSTMVQHTCSFLWKKKEKIEKVENSKWEANLYFAPGYPTLFNLSWLSFIHLQVLIHDQTAGIAQNALGRALFCLKMTEHISVKTLQVLLIGEHLRIMIRDRRYHLRTFSCCFVGRELVDWLIKNSEANSRTGAAHCMNILLENNVIHHG